MLLTLLSVFCFASAGPIDSWLHQRPTPSNLSNNITQYKSMQSAFVTKLTPWLRRRITYLSSSAHTQFINGQCKPAAYFKVFTANAIPFEVNKNESQFVDSIFRVESAYCIKDTNIETVYKTFMSSEYRLDVMPRLGQYSHNGRQTCIGTEPVPGVLKKSSYCLDVHTLRKDNAIISHSILNQSTFSDTHQPLYYREEVLIIAKVDEHTTGIYRVTFTRSDDLGMASKFLIQSTVDSTEDAIYDGLERWLRIK